MHEPRPPLLGTLRKLVPNAQELGIVNGICYDFDRVLQRLSVPARLYRYALVAQPVPPSAILPPRRGASIEVRRVSPRDPRLRDLELTDDVLAYREGQGAICQAAFKNDTMIGCLWFCLGPYGEDEVRCHFTPVPQGETAWDFGAYVLPEHRSGLVFLRLWDEVNAFLRQREVRWSLSRISVFNLMSLQSHNGFGTVTLGHASFLCVGSWQVMYHRTSGCTGPRFHLSRSGRQVPRLTVHAPTSRPVAQS